LSPSQATPPTLMLTAIIWVKLEAPCSWVSKSQVVRKWKFSGRWPPVRISFSEWGSWDMIRRVWGIEWPKARERSEVRRPEVFRLRCLSAMNDVEGKQMEVWVVGWLSDEVDMVEISTIATQWWGLIIRRFLVLSTGSLLLVFPVFDVAVDRDRKVWMSLPYSTLYYGHIGKYRLTQYLDSHLWYVTSTSSSGRKRV
jgi:hypothetical protein